jgi:hypothetical protein
MRTHRLLCLLLAGALLVSCIAGCTPRPAPPLVTPTAAGLPAAAPTVVASTLVAATPDQKAAVEPAPVETAAGAPAAALELYVFYSPL